MSEKKRILLVRYGEIALRGGNRKIFEAKLIDRIRKSLAEREGYFVTKEQGRLVLENSRGVDFDFAIPRVTDIFGILGVSKCTLLTDQSIDSLKAEALAQLKEIGRPFTFKIETRRANKRYPMLSNDVSYAVGEYIIDNIPDAVVDVHNPEITLGVELRNYAYVYSGLVKGLGGLPTGSGGKATLLLSGGFDSPVAGFLTAKRGAELESVYFHSPPFTSERAKEKVIALAKRLSRYTGGMRLYVVGFTDTQLFLKNNVPPEKLTILLKRAMIRAAEKIANNSKSIGLVMGDSIGQVASQTMESIFAVNSAASYPIYRPLCGMDKQEIIDLADKIGTAEISILPYEDCCTLFVAEHPETKPKKSIIESIEQKNFAELDALLDAAVKAAEIIEV